VDVSSDPFHSFDKKEKRNLDSALFKMFSASVAEKDASVILKSKRLDRNNSSLIKECFEELMRSSFSTDVLLNWVVGKNNSKQFYKKIRDKRGDFFIASLDFIGKSYNESAVTGFDGWWRSSLDIVDLYKTSELLDLSLSDLVRLSGEVVDLRKKASLTLLFGLAQLNRVSASDSKRLSEIYSYLVENYKNTAVTEDFTSKLSQSFTKMFVAAAKSGNIELDPLFIPSQVPLTNGRSVSQGGWYPKLFKILKKEKVSERVILN